MKRGAQGPRPAGGHARIMRSTRAATRADRVDAAQGGQRGAMKNAIDVEYAYDFRQEQLT
jgi:hypothetical protein